MAKSKLFTPEELEELRRADEELDAEFVQTQEEIRESRKRDRAAQLDKLDNRGKKIADYQAAYRKANKEKIAAQQAAYREANKEKIAAQQAAYYEANKEKIADYQAAYREANKEKIAAQKAAWQKKNREKWNAYQRQYRAKKKAASCGANTGKRQSQI